MSTDLVLVTGATGFIASWVIKLLISKGYAVIGTGRSFEKANFLITEYGRDFKFVVTKDITAPGAYDEAFKAYPAIKYVIHTASAVVLAADDFQKDVIDPSVKGTINLLNAAKVYGSVKKIVFSSSISSMMQPPAFGAGNPNVTFTEELWNPLEEKDYEDLNAEYAYLAAMTFAEKEIFKFIKAESPSFSITTVHFPFVWGPPINHPKSLFDLNASNKLLAGLFSLPKELTELPPVVPNVPAPYIDVRDAAEALIQALFSEELDNKRTLHIAGVTDVLHTLEIYKRASPQLAEILPNIPAGELVPHSKWNSDATEKVIDIKYIPLEKTLVDLATELQKLQVQS